MNPLDFTSLHSLEAEQSVIGGLLLVPSAIDKIPDLSEADFFTAANRTIYRRICMMAANRQPIDAVTVTDALKGAGELDAVGGFGYVVDLATNAAGAANITRYAQIITDKRMLRDLLTASSEVAEIATENSGKTVAERIDMAQARIMALANDSVKAEPVQVSELLGEVLEDLERRVEAGDGVTGLPTGFSDLDAITHGLQDGDLIVIAGRPSMGKTTLAQNIAEHVALAGKVALFFSLEMSRNQLVQRALSSIGGIDIGAMRSGRMTEEDYAKLSATLARLSSAKMIIDDSPALSVAQMAGRARKIVRQHGLDLIVIDYLQLMGGVAGKSRNEELGDITRALKLMARELAVPVVLLSQLSRKVEERGDKRPMLSDLRDSGAIEQDSDVVLMAYRDEYYHAESPFRGLAEIIIRKQRMGELGDVKLAFQGRYCRFASADRGDVAAAYAAKPRGKARRGMDD